MFAALALRLVGINFPEARGVYRVRGVECQPGAGSFERRARLC